MTSTIFQDWSEKSAINAASLAAESRLLFKAGYLSRAYYLAHMSTEESAKSVLLHAMSVLGTPESEMTQVAKLLQNHKKKIEFLVSYATTSSEELKAAIGELQRNLIDHINDVKNDTMYVSCKKGVVSVPAEKVSAINVESYIKFADSLLQQAKNLLRI